MKISLLLLAALWVAPLTLAQSVLPEPAEPVSAIAASGVAEQLPALALLPQQTEAFISVGHPAALAEKFGTPAESVQAVSDVEGVALGFSTGSAEALHRALPLLHLAESEETEESPAALWAAAAHELPARIIRMQYAQHTQENVDMALTALEQWHLPPVYAVVSVRPEAAAQLPEWQRRLVEELSADTHAEPMSRGDWKGVRLHLSAEEIEPAQRFSLLQKVRLTEALKRVSLCVMCTVREHALVVAICSAPEEAQPAVSPVSSVLSSEHAAFLASRPHLFAAGYVSPALQALQRDAQLQSMRSLFGFATGVFKTLAVEDAPALDVYQGAVNALACIQEQTERLCPEQKRAGTLLAWDEGDTLCMESEGDACGSRFLPTEGVALPESPSRFFTFVSDPMERCTRVEFAAVLQAFVHLTEGVAETLSNENRETLQSALMQYRLFQAEQDAFAAAFDSWNRGLSGRVAVVADGQGEVPASLIGGSPAHMVPIPRVAVCAGMRNRADVAEAWAQALSAAGASLRKMGADDSVLREMPLTSSQEGAVTLHSLSLPMCCPAFSPSVALSERQWVLSSSAVLGAQLASAPTSAAGAVGSASFSFRPQPLAELLQKMSAEESELAESAASAARMAERIREVSGQITITHEDTMRLHVDVKLRR
ncbi:MAG: hypothetical protein MJ051_06065 [Akkermansia sp.]|nr:hypothetical protein [Akkermansia sp.]